MLSLFKSIFNKRPIQFTAPSGYMPQAQTKLSAGYDVKAKKNYKLVKGETCLIGTNVRLSKCSPKYYLELIPRSSLRKKLGITGIGVIDADFKGEIMVIMCPNKDYIINRGERVAQLIPKKVLRVTNGLIKNVDRVGGIGSSGTRTIQVE
tara:strand:- start:380 stop:829 length:450 start_codon:yes stop_codon:yes gene_type:complete